MSTDVILTDRAAGWAIHEWLNNNVGNYGEEWKYTAV